MKSESGRFTDGAQWVWLDLDDTLIDFRANSRTALRAVYAEESLDRFYPTADGWVAAYEAHNHKLWERYNRAEISQDYLRVDRFATPLAPFWPEGVEALEAFCRRLDPLYLSILAKGKAMIPGASGLLDHLRSCGYNIGILSNGFTDVQYRKLRNCGLDQKVDLVVLSDDIGVNKPDVRLFRHAMERAGNTCPGVHVMIGDNPDTDILGAVRAGWRAVLFNPAAADVTVDGPVVVAPSLGLVKTLF